MPELETLTNLIATTISPWENPFVERAVFGTADPAQIATSIDIFCRDELSSPVAEGLFYESSQGAVSGLRLQDGREVVVKAHPPGQSLAFLHAVYEVQRRLAQRGYPCPCPLLPPRPLARGHAMTEELVDSGNYVDAHHPPIRRLMAAHLATLVCLTRDLTTLPGLRPGLLSHWQPGKLWPPPHSAIFNFEATTAGSEWIDELARKAKETLLRASNASQPIIGHTDWSVKHFRFKDDKVCVIYDWDSIALEQETIIVGDAARGFTMTWNLDTPVPLAPAAEEARAFVAEYEAARGKAFTGEERVIMSAAATYAMAYSARCEHCLDPNPTSFPMGSYREALARYGAHLLV